jgi:hypothetical protein
MFYPKSNIPRGKVVLGLSKHNKSEHLKESGYSVIWNQTCIIFLRNSVPIEEPGPR